jgi:molecular chaperone DnaK
VEAAIAELKTAMDGSDTEAIKAKTNALAQAAMKLGEAMYKQAGAEAGADGGEAPKKGNGKAEDDVVDADFTEVKDDDRKSA